MFWDKQEEIITIQKNKTEFIEVSYVERNNKKYILESVYRVLKKEKMYTGKSIATPLSQCQDKYDAIISKLKTYLKKE